MKLLAKKLTMSLRAKQFAMLWLGLLALALLIANGFVWSFRLDLSAGQSYTISDASRKIMAALSSPAEITYYLSDSLKNRDPLFQQMADLLYEYGEASKGKVRVNIVPADGQEATLQSLGIQSMNMNVVDKAQISQSMVYSGLVIRYLDQTRVLPFVANPALLEYDLGVQLGQIARGKPLTLGFLVGVEAQDILSQYNIIRSELGKFVSLKVIQKGEDIPADVDVLFVFRGEGLKAEELVPVERFALSGKGVLFGAETYAINLQYQMMPMPTGKDSELVKMLDSWGVVVEPTMVASHPDFVQRFPISQDRVVPYPFWLNLVAEDANPKTVLGAGLRGLDLFWASPLTLKDGVTGEVVVKSVSESTVLGDFINTDPESAIAAFESAQAPREARNMVVSVSGQAKSYFRSRFPDKNLPEGTDELQILVVGDSDFAADVIQVTRSVSNLEFLQSALVWLGNDENLRQLKGRSAMAPSLSKVRSAEDRVVAEALAVLFSCIVPVALLVAGMIVHLVRRRVVKG